MRKQNGFIISTTLYSIFGIMLLTVFYILYVLSSNRYALTTSINDVKKDLETRNIYLYFAYDDVSFIDTINNIRSNNGNNVQIYSTKISNYNYTSNPLPNDTLDKYYYIVLSENYVDETITINSSVKDNYNKILVYSNSQTLKDKFTNKINDKVVIINNLNDDLANNIKQ